MNAPRLTDAQISQALSGHVPERAPGGLRERIMGAVRTTTQQRRMPSFLPGAIALPGLQEWTGRGRMSRGAWVLVAAALLALLAATAIFIGSQRGPLLATLPEPTTTPTTTPTPSAAVSPTPAVASTKLTWTKVTLDERWPQVAWLGDQFVLVDQDAGAVRTSIDGQTWHALQPGDDPGYAELLRPRRGHPAGAYVSWEDDIVGWWNPQEPLSLANQPPVTARDNLRIVRPPAAPTVTTPFKGRIESIGIGPKGIVAQVHSHIDWDAWVATRLGENWVSHFTGMEFRDGILDISVDNGPGLHVVWADEGFEPGDYMDAGFEWYSPDGEQWTAIPSVGSPESVDFRGFPTGFGDVVGVSDGFIARGINPEDTCPLPDGCGEMWHSSDGLTWRNLGPAPEWVDGRVLPWLGGALVTDGVGRFDFWTSEGHSELPMASELPAAWNGGESSTGPLGLVTVSIDDKEVLVTRDGVAWDVQQMPAEMAADDGGFLNPAPTVAVGERSVLVLLWESVSEMSSVPSLWRGTLVP